MSPDKIKHLRELLAQDKRDRGRFWNVVQGLPSRERTIIAAINALPELLDQLEYWRDRAIEFEGAWRAERFLDDDGASPTERQD